MLTDDITTDESTDIDRRGARALTEYMTVLPEGGDVYSVTTESGSEYAVDAREGRCTCLDHQHRGARCKHLRRVAFATGAEPIPAVVDRGAVDPDLGAHVDATPRVAATDGGEILDAGDDGEILEADTDTDDRPADCGCGAWNADGARPCWPCYRDGFDEPAPAAD